MTRVEKCQGCRNDKKLCEYTPGNSRCNRCIEKNRQGCAPAWPGPKYPANPEAVANINNQRNLQQYSAGRPTATQAYRITDPIAMRNHAGVGMTDGYPWDSRASNLPVQLSYQGDSSSPAMNWISDGANSSYEQGSPYSPDSALSFDSVNKEGTISSQASLKTSKQKRG